MGKSFKQPDSFKNIDKNWAKTSCSLIFQRPISSKVLQSPTKPQNFPIPNQSASQKD